MVRLFIFARLGTTVCVHVMSKCIAHNYVLVLSTVYRVSNIRICGDVTKDVESEKRLTVSEDQFENGICSQPHDGIHDLSHMQKPQDKLCFSYCKKYWIARAIKKRNKNLLPKFVKTFVCQFIFQTLFRNPNP